MEKAEDEKRRPKSVDEAINDIGFGRFQALVTLLCGLAQSSDMLEIQFSNLVSQKLQCTWYITDFGKSFVTASTFSGLWLGTFLWGPLADVYSRVKVTALAMAFVGFYGLLTSVAPNFVWVVLLRFLVGFGIGGVQPLTNTVLNEFTPATKRGFVWYISQAIWNLGGVVAIGLGWLLLPLRHGWRLLAFGAAVPILLLQLPWLLWLPESPRQLLVHGHFTDARKSVNRIADSNGAPAFDGDFQCEKATDEKGKLSKLFSSFYFVRVSLLLVFLNFVGGFNYYGVILLNLQVPLVLRDRCRTPDMTPMEATLDRMCHSCSDVNYMELLLPCLADIGACLSYAVIFERFFTRKFTMVLNFGLVAVLVPLLSLCMAVWVRTILFCAIRFFIAVGYNAVVLYVQEVYPTSLRATAAAFQSSFARLAASVAPFVAQLFLKQVSLLGALFIFSGLMVGGLLASLLLPKETKDRPLMQTTESKDAKSLGSSASDYGTLKAE